MAVSDSFRAFALEQLARVAPDVPGRRMFGGVGIYSGADFFALLDDDALYLKADDGTRDAFVQAGMQPFHTRIAPLNAPSLGLRARSGVQFPSDFRLSLGRTP